MWLKGIGFKELLGAPLQTMFYGLNLARIRTREHFLLGFKYEMTKYCKLIVLFYLPVGMEHLISLLTFQRFQILLTRRMFPVWDFVVGIFA